MNQPPTVADMMAAYALDAVDLARANFHQELDFSEKSVEAVEQILGKYYDSLPHGFFLKFFKSSPPPETLDQVCKMFGAYIGEIIRRQYGGEWEIDDQSSPGNRILSLRSGKNRIWPPAKVYKRIVNGAEDNVWHYFQIIVKDWKSSE